MVRLPAFQQEPYLQALFLSRTHCRPPRRTVLSLNPCTRSTTHKILVTSGALFPSSTNNLSQGSFFTLGHHYLEEEQLIFYFFFISGRSFHPMLDIKAAQSFPAMFRPRKRGNEIYFFFIFMKSAY